jgi:hypothetical protein
VSFGSDRSITFPILEAFDIDFDIIISMPPEFIDNIGDVKSSYARPIKHGSGLKNVNNIT